MALPLAENLIKLHKSQLAFDHTSCRSPLANQVRPVVNTPAYWLMLTVRDAISQPQALASAEFTTFPKLACRDRDKGPHRLCRRLSRGGVVSRRCAQPAGRWNRYYRGMVP